jgi:hypothetical protein
VNIGNATSDDFQELDVERHTKVGSITSSWGNPCDHQLAINRFHTICMDEYPAIRPGVDVRVMNLARMSAVASWSGYSLTTTDHDDVIGMADVNKTIELLYKWEHDKKGRVASAYVVYFVEQNFSRQNLSAINNLLLHISAERLTEWSMVAILRSSFSAKAYLPAWSMFMSSVRDRLKDNERLERLLVGLNR